MPRLLHGTGAPRSSPCPLPAAPPNPADKSGVNAARFPKSFLAGQTHFPSPGTWLESSSPPPVNSAPHSTAPAPRRRSWEGIFFGDLRSSNTGCRSEAPFTIPRRRGAKGRKCLSAYRTRHSHPAPFPGHFCHCSLKDEQIFSKTHLKEKRGPHSAGLLKQRNLISAFPCLPPKKLEAVSVVLGLHLGKSTRTLVYKERRSVSCSACPCFSFPARASASSSSQHNRREIRVAYRGE